MIIKLYSLHPTLLPHRNSSMLPMTIKTEAEEFIREYYSGSTKFSVDKNRIVDGMNPPLVGILIKFGFQNLDQELLTDFYFRANPDQDPPTGVIIENIIYEAYRYGKALGIVKLNKKKE